MQILKDYFSEKLTMTWLNASFSDSLIILQVAPPDKVPSRDNRPLEHVNDQSIMHQTFTELPPSTPDCIQTEYGPKLTPVGRYQVRHVL